MKIIKIIVGTLAGLWSIGILLKLLRNLPLIFGSPLGMSRLLGAIAGMLIMGVICYSCFKSAMTELTGTHPGS